LMNYYLCYDLAPKLMFSYFSDTQANISLPALPYLQTCLEAITKPSSGNSATQSTQFIECSSFQIFLLADCVPL